jgi:hypothetical protein
MSSQNQTIDQAAAVATVVGGGVGDCDGTGHTRRDDRRGRSVQTAHQLRSSTNKKRIPLHTLQAQNEPPPRKKELPFLLLSLPDPARAQPRWPRRRRPDGPLCLPKRRAPPPPPLTRWGSIPLGVSRRGGRRGRTRRRRRRL